MLKILPTHWLMIVSRPGIWNKSILCFSVHDNVPDTWCWSPFLRKLDSVIISQFGNTATGNYQNYLMWNLLINFETAQVFIQYISFSQYRTINILTTDSDQREEVKFYQHSHLLSNSKTWSLHHVTRASNYLFHHKNLLLSLLSPRML